MDAHVFLRKEELDGWLTANQKPEMMARAIRLAQFLCACNQGTRE